MNARKTLIENDFASLWYHPDEGIIQHEFLQPVPDDIFMEVLMSGLEIMQEHGAQKWLSDDRGNSILSAEASAWSLDYWLPRAIQAGWKYWALIPTTNRRALVNIKRLMAYTAETNTIEIKLFSNPDEGWQWLIQQ
jgi:hypothetical protein